MKKNIIEFPGYQVDENGVVYGVKGKPLSQQNHSGGRVRVGLGANNKTYMRAISRLVAAEFVENPNNYEHVDHIDGNRTNNHYTNLRWVSNEENQALRFEQGNYGAERYTLEYDGEIYQSMADLARKLSRERGSKFDTVRKELQRAKYGNATVYGKVLRKI